MKNKLKEGWAITTNYLKQELFLVDRSKTKKKWWTGNLDNIMIFEKESAARFQIRKYRHNSHMMSTVHTSHLG